MTRFTSRTLLPGLLAMGLISGCTSSLLDHADRTSGRAFIKYWPPPKNDTGLRLAVKDLIDVQGEVTTAGSQHIATTRRPAKQDAGCLRIARARGVTLVGKTNLTELAVTVSGQNEYFGTPVNRLAEASPRPSPAARPADPRWRLKTTWRMSPSARTRADPSGCPPRAAAFTD